MNELIYYPPTVSVTRENFETRKEYLDAYRDCCQHYGYKVRVEGGWKFFEFPEDLQVWRNQK